MKNKPHVTEEEIRGFMDFDALLKSKEKADVARQKTMRIRRVFIGFSGLVTVAIILFVLSADNPGKVKRRADSTATQALLPGPLLQDALVMPDSAAEGAEQEPGIASRVKPNGKAASEVQSKPGARRDKSSLPMVQPAYTQAEPVDGYPALYAFFDRNLSYPVAAVQDSLEGVVDVVFVIDTAGRARNIEIRNSLGVLFDEEVVRLMEKMPLWRPASYNGKPVEEKMSLPLAFKLKRIPNPEYR